MQSAMPSKFFSQNCQTAPPPQKCIIINSNNIDNIGERNQKQHQLPLTIFIQNNNQFNYSSSPQFQQQLHQQQQQQNQQQQQEMNENMLYCNQCNNYYNSKYIKEHNCQAGQQVHLQQQQQQMFNPGVLFFKSQKTIQLDTLLEDNIKPFSYTINNNNMNTNNTEDEIDSNQNNGEETNKNTQNRFINKDIQGALTIVIPNQNTTAVEVGANTFQLCQEKVSDFQQIVTSRCCKSAKIIVKAAKCCFKSVGVACALVQECCECFAQLCN